MLRRGTTRYLLNAGGAHGESIASTRDHIAFELGTSRETVSRLLEEYELRSIVEPTPGPARMIDPRGFGQLLDRRPRMPGFARSHKHPHVPYPGWCATAPTPAGVARPELFSQLVRRL